MNEDWRYSDERMKLREQALNLLLKRYGMSCKKTENQYTLINQSTSVPMTGYHKEM